jgi:hypothetical protein
MRLRGEPYGSIGRNLTKLSFLSSRLNYYSERFIGDTGIIFRSYEANSNGNRVSPIKRSH